MLGEAAAICMEKPHCAHGEGDAIQQDGHAFGFPAAMGSFAQLLSA